MKKFLLLIGAFGLALFGMAASFAQRGPAAPESAAETPRAAASARATPTSPFETPAPTPDDLKVRQAIERGLTHLASIQREDGSWYNDVGLKLGYSYRVEARDKPHIGVTAFCCMAFVANGHTPEQGLYAKNVKAGLHFLLNNVDNFGHLKANGSRMYSHAIGTLFLAEIYGMVGGDRLKDGLQKAVQFIVNNQVSGTEARGGWRYEPGQTDADMSITVCQLQALRAARNAGLAIKQSVIDAARSYIALNYEASDGSFYYQPSLTFGRRTFPLTAAGIVALQSTGKYDSYKDPKVSREIDLGRSIRYLLQNRPDSNEYFRPESCDFSFFYGHYYAAQAIKQYSHINPTTWKQWNDLNRRHFLRMQQDNGAWVDEVGGRDKSKNAYATAMACLVLSIPHEYLPIFQH